MGNTKISREEKLALYEKLVASYSKAELKGATIPYTSLNGHMFSMLTKGDEVALRLPEDAMQKFIEKYKTRHPEQYGIVQTKYAVVPDDLLKKTEEINPYFEKSYNFVSSLKPKPTTKKKK